MPAPWCSHASTRSALDAGWGSAVRGTARSAAGENWAPDLRACARTRAPRDRRADWPCPGSGAKVEVVRDRWGIPHIYAQSEDDLFFAQGLRAGAGPALPDGAVAPADPGPSGRVPGTGVGGARPHDPSRDPLPGRPRRRVGELRSGRCGAWPSASWPGSTRTSTACAPGRPWSSRLAGFAPEHWAGRGPAGSRRGLRDEQQRAERGLACPPRAALRSSKPRSSCGRPTRRWTGGCPTGLDLEAVDEELAAALGRIGAAPSSAQWSQAGKRRLRRRGQQQLGGGRSAHRLDRQARARQRSAPRPRPPVAAIPRAPRGARASGHRRGGALVPGHRHRPQRAHRLGPHDLQPSTRRTWSRRPSIRPGSGALPRGGGLGAHAGGDGDHPGQGCARASRSSSKFTRHGPVVFEDKDRAAPGLRPALDGQRAGHRRATWPASPWPGRGAGPSSARRWRAGRCRARTSSTPTSTGNIGYQATGLAPIRRRRARACCRLPGVGGVRLDGLRVDRRAAPCLQPGRRLPGHRQPQHASAGRPRGRATSGRTDSASTAIVEVLREARGFGVAESQALQQDVVALPARSLVPLVRGDLLRGGPRRGSAARLARSCCSWPGTSKMDRESAGAAMFAAFHIRLAADYVAQVLPRGAPVGSRPWCAPRRPRRWWTACAARARRGTFSWRGLSARRCWISRRRLGNDPAAWKWGDLHQARFAHRLGVGEAGAGPLRPGARAAPRVRLHREHDRRRRLRPERRRHLPRGPGHVRLGQLGGDERPRPVGPAREPPLRRPRCPYWAEGRYFPLAFSPTEGGRGRRAPPDPRSRAIAASPRNRG